MADRFYEPVKVGSFTDMSSVSDWDDDDDVWEDCEHDVYAVRPRDRSGRTLGSRLRLGRDRADLLCDLLEEVRRAAFSSTTA